MRRPVPTSVSTCIQINGENEKDKNEKDENKEDSEKPNTTKQKPKASHHNFEYLGLSVVVEMSYKTLLDVNSKGFMYELLPFQNKS